MTIARASTGRRTGSPASRSRSTSGRPYVLVLFGDHLPGLRMHQMNDGMVSTPTRACTRCRC
jgi:hypothetical protein